MCTLVAIICLCMGGLNFLLTLSRSHRAWTCAGSWEGHKYEILKKKYSNTITLNFTYCVRTCRDDSIVLLFDFCQASSKIQQHFSWWLETRANAADPFKWKEKAHWQHILWKHDSTIKFNGWIHQTSQQKKKETHSGMEIRMSFGF